MSTASNESRLMRAAALAALTGAATWIFVLRTPGAGLPPAAAAALWALLAVVVVLVVAGVGGRGVWIFTDLLMVGLPCAIVAAAVDRAGHAPLTVAWLAPLVLGLPGSVLALLAGRREDRRRASDDRRLEADRAVARVHWRLRTGTAPVSDDDIRAAIAELEATTGGDPFDRAALLLGAMAPALAARPELATELLPRALSAAGARPDLNALAAAAAEHTDDRGRAWLRDVFPTLSRAG